MKKISASFAKIFSILFVIVTLFAIGSTATYINEALGWAEPTGNPLSAPGALSITNGNVGINYRNATSTLSVNGVADFFNNIVSGVGTPIAGKDAINKDYLDTQLASSTSGSLTYYYQTLDGNSLNGPAPTCPTGWSKAYDGYGPRFIALMDFDWLDGGTGGTGGGFGGIQVPPDPPPPAFGGAGSTGNINQTYTVNAFAIGGDSVCAEPVSSVVNAFAIYQNATTTDRGASFSSGCTYDTDTGLVKCNRCIICYN